MLLKTKFYTKYMYPKAIFYVCLLVALSLFLVVQRSFEMSHVLILSMIAIKAYVSLNGNFVELKDSRMIFKIKNVKYELAVEDIISIEWPKEKKQSKDFAAMLFTSKVPDKDGVVQEPSHLLFNFSEYTRDDVECILRYAINTNPNVAYGSILNEIRFSDHLVVEKNYLNQKLAVVMFTVILVGFTLFMESKKGLNSGSLTNALLHILKILT